MSNYPYTEAYDALRSIPERSEHDGISCKLSRAECAQIISFVASSLGVSAEYVVSSVAKYAAREVSK